MHKYMVKIGIYKGPNIKKIFQHLEDLKPYMLEGSKLFYYNAMGQFSLVSKAVLGTELHPMWRQQALKTTEGLPLTSKLHRLMTHMRQWIDRNGRSLGKEEES